MPTPFTLVRSGRRFAALLLLVVFHGPPAIAADPRSESLVLQGNTAFKNGNRKEAVELFTKAIAADGSNFLAYYNRGRIHETEARFAPALADYNRILELQPDHQQTLRLRGALQLHLGYIAGALVDFETQIRSNPRMAPRHWQRGIALYYAERFGEARQQFAECARLETNDLEHVLWHFAATARTNGLAQARRALLPAGADQRPFMAVLHALYAGRKTVDEAAATIGPDTAEGPFAVPRRVLMNFHLGLYHEVNGDATRALERMEAASRAAPPGEFSADLARMHLALRGKR